MCSNHNGNKLEISDKKILEKIAKFLEINTFLNNAWIKEDFSTEINNYFVLMKRELVKICGTQQNSV